MKFYIGYTGERPDRLGPYIERNTVPIMTTAISRYNGSKFLPMRGWDTDRIVDSGGFTAVERGGYPFTVEEYHNWLTFHSDKFEWAAVMDYACEARFDDEMSLRNRMNMTLENTIKHFEIAPDSYEVLPVLQGRSPEDYIEFYDMLVDHGIPAKKVGLGTVCRIASAKELQTTERIIREETGVEWIHGFGVKIDGYKMGCTFDSIDSSAWCRAPKNGLMYVDNLGSSLKEIPMPKDSRTRTIVSFKEYYNYVKRLEETPFFECSGCDFKARGREKAAAHHVKTGHEVEA